MTINTTGWNEEEVLIVVKTYPTPSLSHQETVCTAGITRSGHWIRLYPIQYRMLEEVQMYKKYQWISVKVTKNRKDLRPESYKPNHDSIKPGTFISTGNNWHLRKKIILPLASSSLEDIQNNYKKCRTSLGLFRPAEVDNFYWKSTGDKWDDKYIKSFQQQRLFSKKITALEKVPYDFKYNFRCNDPACKGHNISIVDWEIFQAFRRWRKTYGSESKALEKIKDKWLDYFFCGNRDSYFVVGTTYPYPTFIILGVFWPPK